MEGLGIDIRLMFAQIINFGLFFFIFKRFIAPSFYKFIENEKLKEQEKDRLLAEMENKHAEIDKKGKQIIKEAHDNASVILDEAKEEAKKLKEQTLSDAKSEIKQLKEKLNKQYEEDSNSLKKDLKESIIVSSTKMVELVLPDLLDKTMQKKLTESIVKHLSQKKLYEN